MELKSVSRREVKRAFLLADAGRELFKEKVTDLELEYKKFKEKYNNYGEKDLDNLIGKEKSHESRINIYNSMDWYFSVGFLEDMGVWPEMCRLPPELTTGNVVETANHVKNLESSLKKSRLPNMDSVIKNIEFVKPNFPLIAVPGDLIRGKTYKKWVMENHGNYFPHKILKFSLDDGNLRAVSYSIAGHDDSPAYIGVRE